ncbi:MAG: LTA synthase family protein, partial [Exiguobacterium oxidotolerans]
MIGFGYAFYLLLGMLKFMLFSFYTNTEVSFKLVLLNLAGMLLLSSWTLLIQWKKRRWIWLGLLVLHSFLLVSDLWYYRYFDDLLSVSLMSQMLQMSDVGSGFMALIVPTDFFLFADSIIFGLVLIFLRKKRFTVAKRQQRRSAVAAFLAGIVLFAAPLTYAVVKQD